MKATHGASQPRGAFAAAPLWVKRAALALLLPAGLLLGLEFGLRLSGYGRPSSFLIPDAAPGVYRTNPDFAGLFLPGNFDLRPLNFRVTARKAPGTLRVVLLGESAAQGVPVPSFAFGPQLRAQLRALYPGREVEVLDTGIVAINSHVVYRIARDMARFEPDLFVVYMGNNEVVGPYGPGCAYLPQMPPLWVIRASVFVRSTRIGQLAGALVRRLGGSPGRAVEWGGMSMFIDSAVAGDDPRLGAVYANFEANLRSIVSAAAGSGAKTVVCTVVGNLKDCAPFLSLHRADLSGDAQARWAAALDAGRLAWRLGDASARRHLEEALAIDPHHADTLFMLGRLDLASADTASARRRFCEALHWDALRFRPDPAINAVIRRVAADRAGQVVLADAAMELGSDPASTAPLCGRELLFEHVHFDWEGNVRMARLLAEACRQALGSGDATSLLDPQACARAVGYTAHERLPMLLRIQVLVRKPPFNHQLTYVEDQAAMARAIAQATGQASDPRVLRDARAALEASLRRDPRNPALKGILEGILSDQGEGERALGLADEARVLLPADPATGADMATLLARLGRYGEAFGALEASVRSGADTELLAPAVLDVADRARRYEPAVALLDQAIRSKPESAKLRLVRAALRRAAGDKEGAEREMRDVLSAHPGDEDALEGLLSLLTGDGRTAEAASLALSAADSQPMNQENNLRAASALEARGDLDRSALYMEAAERSGPVNATFELSLALKLYRLKRAQGMMERLALARTLSLSEGSPAVTQSIETLIERMRRETGVGLDRGP